MLWSLDLGPSSARLLGHLPSLAGQSEVSGCDLASQTVWALCLFCWGRWVLAHLDCYDEILYPGSLNHRNLSLVLKVGNSKTKALADSMSKEGLSLVNSVFSLCPHMVKRTQQLSCIRALIPLMRAPPL